MIFWKLSLRSFYAVLKFLTGNQTPEWNEWWLRSQQPTCLSVLNLFLFLVYFLPNNRGDFILFYFFHGKILLFIWRNKSKISCLGTILKYKETPTLFYSCSSRSSIPLLPSPASSVDHSDTFRSPLAHREFLSPFPLAIHLLVACHACGPQHNI